MKVLFSLVLFISLLGIANAQQTYFSKRFHFGLINDINVGQKTIAFGNSYDLIVSSTGFGVALSSVFVRIDSIANTEFIKAYGANPFYSYSGGYSGLNRLLDSSYVYVGGIEDSVINGNVMLYKLSKNGDSVWTRQYVDTSFQSGWMCKPTKDGGFVITGQTATYDPNGDVLLIKTDSNGNLQWQKHYGGGGYDIGVSIDTCFDGGFLICGYTESFGDNAGTPCGNWYIIKTDAVGNVKWWRAPGGPYTESAWSCLQSKDGNYVVAGHYTYSDPSVNCTDGYGKAYIIKLDTSGNTMWAKDYGPFSLNTTIFSIKELSDSSLIATGQTDDSTANWRQRGFIVKTNAQGDSLWYRTYANIIGPHSDNALVDITTSADGGFVTIGTVYPSAPDTGTQDVWVLRVDSSGCEVSNCAISGLIPIPSNVKEVTIYPNPSNGLFHLQNNSSEEIEKIEVFNCIGQNIFFKYGRTEEIDLSNAASGIYFYSIRTKQGKVFSGKIVKE